MNSELQIFTNEQLGDIRTIMQGGEPWFVAADVCKMFGVSNSRSVTSRLYDDEKGVSVVDTPGGKQNLTVVNEGGLYHLLFSMEPNNARGLSEDEVNKRINTLKEFRCWVTHKVLPTIRKHGAYMTEQTLEDALTSPDFLIRLATQLKEEQEARRALEAENAAMQPKALFADAVTASHTSILIGELAKILKQNGVDIGQNKLFERLRQDGYLMKTGSSKNMPTQSAMEKGLFEIKESTKTEPNGSVRIMRTTKVTGKGQMYFVNLFLNKASDNATA